MTELFSLDATGIEAKYKEERYLREAEDYRLLRLALASSQHSSHSRTNVRRKPLAPSSPSTKKTFSVARRRLNSDKPHLPSSRLSIRFSVNRPG